MAQSKKDSSLRSMLLNTGAVRPTSQPAQVRTVDPVASRAQAIAVRRAELNLKPQIK